MWLTPGLCCRFITHGLYSLCRHPNYAGEICMWFSIYALAGTPNVWRTHPYIAASPLFITFLILYVSGINLPWLPNVC